VERDVFFHEFFLSMKSTSIVEKNKFEKKKECKKRKNSFISMKRVFLKNFQIFVWQYQVCSVFF
jgi:hypothetical protein